MHKLPARANSPWHPIYSRRFRAALAVAIGETSFSMLTPALQRVVDQECDKINKARGNILPWGVAQRGFEPNLDHIATWHGVSMARLQLPTGVDGLDWRDFLGTWAVRNPDHAYLGFRRFHPATEE